MPVYFTTDMHNALIFVYMDLVFSNTSIHRTPILRGHALHFSILYYPSDERTPLIEGHFTSV